MAQVEPLSRRRRLFVGIAIMLYAVFLATSVVVLAVLDQDARGRREAIGWILIVTVPLVAVPLRRGEAGVSDRLLQLLRVAYPLGVGLIGTALVLPFVSPDATNMGWRVGITYALGAGIVAVAESILGLAFIRDPGLRN